jgi:hypothetical protein
MQGAIVMAIAVCGLGCQNKTSDVGDVTPVYRPIDSMNANPYPESSSPSSTSYYYQRSYNDYALNVYPTRWDAVRATICSFVLGHDPGVPTARDILASVYGDAVEP